ncbi:MULTISPECIES: TetR/AcrR family transcriptional regulator [unclassified Spirosoma]|uniref:TetR/AcrR family transcriptional regulator n=1 Tax=unclassified Spirosoma TaxID=2621999 RepID=UPI0009643327|nr:MULTISPECIES: TetR/AcrR family transcriptional regulator [unclassified Spirosoma]MBN8823965.1 TetR/AcrR family transcriptional regulator [Spirosoma sp.]OJW70378.1 MAG: TetR family transcriptional regulator [Spirosoma sp. 48-14]
MKQRILAEAERLFWRYGIRSVTMEDIAKQLGISKKTIYQHFTDKEQILSEVIQDKFGRDHKAMACVAVEAENPVAEIMHVLAMIQKNADQVSPNLLIDMKRHYPQAFALFKQYKEGEVLRSILENIQKGIEQGLYRSDLNPGILARLRVEQIELAFNNDIFPSDQYTMQQIQYELMHHFIRGMLTEQGFTIYNQYVNQYNHEVH